MSSGDESPRRDTDDAGSESKRRGGGTSNTAAPVSPPVTADARITDSRVVYDPPLWRIASANVALATATGPDGQVVEGVGATLVGTGRAVAKAERSARAMLAKTDLSYRVGTVLDARGNKRVRLDRTRDPPRVEVSGESFCLRNLVAITTIPGDGVDTSTTTVGKAWLRNPLGIGIHHQCLEAAVTNAERELGGGPSRY